MPRGGGGTVLDEQIVDRYLDTVADLAVDGPRDLELVYTPLHGVGGTSVQRVSRRRGSASPPSCPSRSSPTSSRPSRSPTRRSRARWTWRWRSPATAVPTWSSPTTRCRPVRRRGARAASGGGCCAGATRSGRCCALLRRGKQSTYACSIVSSSLLGKMAAAAEQPAETLTGFQVDRRVEGLAGGYERRSATASTPST